MQSEMYLNVVFRFYMRGINIHFSSKRNSYPCTPNKQSLLLLWESHEAHENTFSAQYGVLGLNILNVREKWNIREKFEGMKMWFL